jgi:hypothetical protein
MQTITDGPVVLHGKIRQAGVDAGISRREMAGLIEAGSVVVLRGLFDAAALLRLRSAVLDWARRTPPYPHGPTASVPRINFHRRDDGTYRSSIPHLFAQYGFGDWDSLESELAGFLKPVCEPLLDLENDLAGTTLGLEDPSLRCKIIHYPAGGGYQAKHVHPYLPQKVLFCLSLTRYAVDFHAGSVSIDTPCNTVDVDELFDIGNVVLFKCDLPHGFLPVDSRRRLDWSSPAGLWLLSMELVETHANSRLV